MQHKEQVIPNSETTETKEQIINEFIHITHELFQPHCQNSIFAKHELYKNKVNQLREHGSLTAKEAWNIANCYQHMVGKHVFIKRGFVSLTHCKAQHADWLTYSNKLKIDELQKLVKSAMADMEIFTTGETQSEPSLLGKNFKRIIKGYKEGKIDQASLMPLVDTLVKFYLNIMDKITKAQLDEISQLSPKRIFIRDVLMQFREAQLIEADDAYKIALAYVYASNTKNFQTMVTLTRQREWKLYAAQAGHIEALKEINPGNEFFIQQKWQDFMKSTVGQSSNKSTVIGLGTLFNHNKQAEVLISIQRKLDACSHEGSIDSSKRMLQVIAEFYFEQCESRNSNDKFFHELSNLIVDILLNLSKSDKTIKTILEEEGTNAFKFVNKLKSQPSEVLLKHLAIQCSPIVLKNILISLHMARPKVNRTADFCLTHDIGNNL